MPFSTLNWLTKYNARAVEGISTVRIDQNLAALLRRREFQSFVDLGKREFMRGHHVPHSLDFLVAEHPDDPLAVQRPGVDGSCDGDVLLGQMVRSYGRQRVEQTNYPEGASLISHNGWRLEDPDSFFKRAAT